ncbi:MAG: LysM peptidoglycan-binding domain-containing protein [Anaerolineae bacterium]
MQRWVERGLVLACLLAFVFVTPVFAESHSAYVVQPGDTLFSISRRYGVSVHELAAANGLAWNAWIYVGQRLTIPGLSSPSPAPAPSATGSIYVVQPGDTLLSIAFRHGISVSRLASTNGLAWNAWVYTGQRLVIPEEGASAPTPSSGGIHVVQRGDTLFSIARRYSTTVASLRATNGLRSDTIYVGQRLVIPGGASTPAPVQPAPGHGSAGEKWIDVNLSTQTVTAYEGQTPVYTALASTGTWRTPTVAGTYRIYAKYRATLMSGPGYYLPDVPYTMYFFRGYALHGTYWHNNFGTPMSHGCVNLSTPDAAWFYSWAPIGTKVVSHY